MKGTPWTERLEVPDPQVFDAAIQYDKARQILDGELLFPFLNVSAMAIELFLKSLASKRVEFSVDDVSGINRIHAQPLEKHHRLEELFDAIDSEIARELEMAFQQPKQALGGLSLRGVLRDLEQLLLRSRYPFEQGKPITDYDLRSLRAMCDFLRNTILAMEPRLYIDGKLVPFT